MKLRKDITSFSLNKNFIKKEKKKIIPLLIYNLKKTPGVGLHLAKKICKTLGFDVNTRSSFLSNEDIQKQNSIVKLKYRAITDRELLKNKYDFIDKMKKINSYKGVRHKYGLPVRGRRTKTNAKTRRI